tara:strand:- start:6941 stop:7687 length:747 start_codon:yes stop_codon:yes gene_type:complete
MENVLNNESTESQVENNEINGDTSLSNTDIENTQCTTTEAAPSILDRYRTTNKQSPVINPDKLSVLATPKDKVFAAFPLSIDLTCLMIKEVKGSYTEEKPYPVTDEVVEKLEHDKALQSVTFYMIQLENGQIFITYCKNGSLNGYTCNWFTSKKACLDISSEEWISMSTNHEEGIYDAIIADEQPDLPTEGPEFYSALELALEDHFIDSLDHPILVANNIGQPKRSSKQSTTRRNRRSSASNKESISE